MSFLGEYDGIAATDPQGQVAVAFRWLRSNWREMYQELRQNRPIFKTPAFTFVSRWGDVIEVLSQNELFSVRGYRDKMDPAIGPHMLARDGTSINWQDKSVMRSVLPWDDLGEVRSLAGDIARESLKAQRGRVEVVSALSRLVPLRIVQRYFGFPGPTGAHGNPDATDATMLAWSKATQWDIFHNPTNDATVHAKSVEAGEAMRAYVWTLLDSKRRNLDVFKDPVSRVVRLVGGGDSGMGLDRAVTNVCGLLVGAIETTAAAITQAAEQILLRPDVLARAIALAQSDSLGPFADIVWEALRFNPVATLVFRYCERDTIIAGGTSYATPVTKGTVLAAGIGSAMFDETAYPNPSDFQPGRPFDNYLHFGMGYHECLGKYVAMKMIPEAIRQLMLLPGLQLLPGDEGKIDFQNGAFPETFYVQIQST